MIRDWRARLLNQGTPVSETAKAYRFLRAVLMTATDDRIFAHNPCRIRGGGKEKPAERPVLTVRQVYVGPDPDSLIFAGSRGGPLRRSTRAGIHDRAGDVLPGGRNWV